MRYHHTCAHELSYEKTVGNFTCIAFNASEFWCLTNDSRSVERIHRPYVFHIISKHVNANCTKLFHETFWLLLWLGEETRLWRMWYIYMKSLSFIWSHLHVITDQTIVLIVVKTTTSIWGLIVVQRLQGVGLFQTIHEHALYNGISKSGRHNDKKST